MKIDSKEHLALFAEEARTYNLQFTCETCAFYNDENESCSHGYPTEEHRALRYADECASVVFCKEREPF